MGISSVTYRFLYIFGLMLMTAKAVSSDLLLEQQWALENLGPMAALASTSETPNGTCATTPTIEGDSYSCDSFLDPAQSDIDLNAFSAWELIPSSSQEVVVALIDTGIDYLHPDLKEKVWLNPGEALYIDGNNNGIDDGCEDQIDLDNNGYLDDCHGINTQVSPYLSNGDLNPAAGDPMDSETGHGTNMAGVLGAAGNNASDNFHGGIVGVTGMHANIRLVTCAAADLQFDAYVTIPGLGGAYGTHEDILACLNYFIELKHRGVNIVVVNGSGGASQLNNLHNIFIPVGAVADKYLLNTPEMSSAIDTLAELDINLVVAAGNNGWNIDQDTQRAYYPAAFHQDNIIAVGALNNQGEPWKYSSFGRWSVDVFAPGERILSTNPRAGITAPENADYIVSDGTSQATAFVSGMLALARTYPSTASLSASDLRRLIVSSGKSIEPIKEKSVSGKLARLFDTNGSGMLNCHNQNFERRQWPRKNTVQVLPGDWFKLEVASYNCHSASLKAVIHASVEPTGETFELLDDGVYPDNLANDGIYTGQWQAHQAQDTYTVSWGTDSVTQTTDSVTIHTSIIVDNNDRNTARIGSWWPSIYRQGFYAGNYRIGYESHERQFSWLPMVPKAGYYEVFAHWPRHAGFTDHAEYTIAHGNPSAVDTTTVNADQSQNGGQWNSLGTFWFEPGEFAITLSNQNIAGSVVADAIKLRPALNQ